MKIFDKDQFFGQLNLAKLSQNQKDKIWERFLELVALEVLDNILDELPQESQEKLFLDLAKNPKKITKFLQENPKVRKFTPTAIEKLKRQVLKNLPK